MTRKALIPTLVSIDSSSPSPATRERVGVRVRDTAEIKSENKKAVSLSLTLPTFGWAPPSPALRERENRSALLRVGIIPTALKS